MTDFATMKLPGNPGYDAPDGMAVRELLHLERGSFAHFELPPGKVTTCVTHRTIEEIWYFIEGSGELWRRDAAREEIVPVGVGTCITIPLGTRFQLRSTGVDTLRAVAVSMPPWPGGDEAYPVEGKWLATVKG